MVSALKRYAKKIKKLLDFNKLKAKNNRLTGVSAGRFGRLFLPI